MSTEVGRTQFLERAALENYPALPEQTSDVRVPVFEGREAWESWIASASQADLRVASALLEERKQQRWRDEDAAAPVIDEALAAEHAEEARRAHEEYTRKRPERYEALFERIANAVESMARRPR